MPASRVMSVNRTTGILALDLSGIVGAMICVTRGGTAAGLRLSATIAMTTTTAILARAINDQRTALPMTASSAWTSSSDSSGGSVGLVFIELTPVEMTRVTQEAAVGNHATWVSGFSSHACG